MSKVFGPVLGFRGQQGEEWRVTVLVAHEQGTAPGALTHSGGSAPGSRAAPSPLGNVGGAAFFGYEFGMPVPDAERTVEYGFDGEDRRWTFAVPSRTQAPRIAYTSCNGFSMPGDMKKIADKNVL